MKKTTYLIILHALFFCFWGLNLGSSFTDDIGLVLTLLWIIYGFVHFRRTHVRLSDQRLKPFWLIMLGIALSMIPAQLYHGQTIGQSLITYRAQFLWLVVPVLINIAPTTEEVVNASTRLTLIIFFLLILKMIYPDLFYQEEVDYVVDESGLFVPGFMIACISVFYYLDKFTHETSWRNIIPVIIGLSVFFLVQNRSSLFPIVLLTGWTILKIQSKYKWLIMLILICLSIYVFLQTADMWSSLIEETTEQLNDEDYNRNKSFAYFLSPLANPSWLTYILGNGFLSAHASDQMADLRTLGIFNSDLGFIGFWNQFGIIPVFVFLWLLVGAYRKKCSMPYYMRLYSALLLAGILTTGYYGNATLLYFAFYYYLFYNQLYNCPTKK